MHARNEKWRQRNDFHTIPHPPIKREERRPAAIRWLRWL